jgi:transposase InsO family protein
VDEHRHVHGVEPICRVLQIAPSGYRRHAARQCTPDLHSARTQRDALLEPHIERVWRTNLQVYGADEYAEVRRSMTDVFERNYGCYGYQRIQTSSSDQEVNISEKVVRRLMKQECLVAATSKRRRYGSTMGEIIPAPENLLNRDFSAGAPNEKWLTDITEFQFPAGKVYLSPMIDCFDGMVVSWSISTRPDAELVNTMLDAAIDKVAASGDRPLVHSDRGGHYRWPGWLSRIAEAKLVRSMSRRGCSPYSVACEDFFGRLKIEMFFQRDWLSTTINEFVAALDAYIRWYNEARIKISLGGLSPPGTAGAWGSLLNWSKYLAASPVSTLVAGLPDRQSDYEMRVCVKIS